mgnify:CR=1 FL=1
MDMRKIISITFVLVVASFFMGRFTKSDSTFLAASESSSALSLDKEQQDTLEWMKRVFPLEFATYKYNYSSADFEGAPILSKPVKLFAGSYLFPNDEGYSVNQESSRGDLDGDGIEEGVVVRTTNYGGTGYFSDLVVLKKTGNEFIEFAKRHSELIFLVTEIGCGLANYRPKDIAPLFSEAIDVDNIYLPERFWHKLK